MIYAVIEDPHFQQQILSVTAQEKKTVTFFRNEKELEGMLASPAPGLFLIEINVSFVDGPGLVESLKINPATRAIPVVVFGSSIRVDLLQDAQEVGADKVLPKAAFREQLPGLLRHYA